MDNHLQEIEQVNQNLNQNVSMQADEPSEVKKTGINFWAITTIVLLIILIIGGIFTLNLYQATKSDNTQKTTVVTTQEPSITPPPQAKNIPDLKFSNLISKSCENNKVDISKLPLTLNSQLKNTYQIDSTAKCFAEGENYAVISTKNDESGAVQDNKTIYFFDEDSKYMGQDDVFQSINSYKSITIDGQQLKINIMEPGPYGISSLGVWLQLIDEKQDKTTGIITRVIYFTDDKSQLAIDMIKKFGEKSSPLDGEDLYTVNGAGKDQFISEYTKYISEQPKFINAVKGIKSDMNGIVF